MTDDESRKAWEAYYQSDISDCWRNCSEPIWQAAVEWATKRERERCVKLIGDWCDSDETSLEKLIDWICQEPKP